MRISRAGFKSLSTGILARHSRTSNSSNSRSSLGGKGNNNANHDSQKALAGKAKAKDKEKSSPRAGANKDLQQQVEKLKEQAAYKDKQISGLSG